MKMISSQVFVAKVDGKGRITLNKNLRLLLGLEKNKHYVFEIKKLEDF